MERSKEAAKNISSQRIAGPLGSVIPPPRSGFREGRAENRGKINQEPPRHTWLTYDTVRYSDELLIEMIMRTSVSVID